MKAIERFQRIRDYVDQTNICDEIAEFLSDDDLNEFCSILEENYDIEYEDEYLNNDDY